MNLINIEVRAAVRTYVFCLSGHNRYVNKVLQIFSRKYIITVIKKIETFIARRSRRAQSFACFTAKNMLQGTWQKVTLCEFECRRRRRVTELYLMNLEFKSTILLGPRSVGNGRGTRLSRAAESCVSVSKSQSKSKYLFPLGCNKHL